MSAKWVAGLLCLLGMCVAAPAVLARPVDLADIRLPEGFRIELFADKVDGARSLAQGTKGTIFVGNRKGSTVRALVDSDGDGKADQLYVLAKGLNMPNGVAFRDGALYVAELNRVLRFDDIESHLADPPLPVIVRDDLPTERHHGWKFIRFGPDGKLYIPIGVPCNVCREDDPRFGTIGRMDPDGSNYEIFASGVRNSVGFDWDPATGELWFTDNGRDWLGDNVPADELNHAPKAGMDFGFPYCHEGRIPDPDYGRGHSCSEFVAPAQRLGPHVAGLGIRFYTGTQFPEAYRGQIFIAEHGSWNRTQKIGYRIMVVRLENNAPVSYEPFAEGWLQGSRVRGRPVDLDVLPDGSMLVSDDDEGVVYRISYR